MYLKLNIYFELSWKVVLISECPDKWISTVQRYKHMNINIVCFRSRVNSALFVFEMHSDASAKM